MYIVGPQGPVVRRGMGCGLCAQLIRDPAHVNEPALGQATESDYIRAGSTALSKAGEAAASLWDVFTGKAPAAGKPGEPISPVVLVVGVVLLAGAGYGIYRWSKGA